MNQNPLQWCMDRVFKTQGRELDCDRVAELTPAYTDARVRGDTLEQPLSEIPLHLAHCPDCADECECLYQVATLESQGRLPPSADLLSELD